MSEDQQENEVRQQQQDEQLISEITLNIGGMQKMKSIQFEQNNFSSQSPYLRKSRLFGEFSTLDYSSDNRSNYWDGFRKGYMRQYQQVREELDSIMQNLDEKMNTTLQKKEKDLIETYKNSMIKVTQELKDLQEKYNTLYNNLSVDSRVKQLENQLKFYKDQSKELTQINQALEDQNKDQGSQITTLKQQLYANKKLLHKLQRDNMNIKQEIKDQQSSFEIISKQFRRQSIESEDDQRPVDVSKILEIAEKPQTKKEEKLKKISMFINSKISSMQQTIHTLKKRSTSNIQQNLKYYPQGSQNLNNLSNHLDQSQLNNESGFYSSNPDYLNHSQISQRQTVRDRNSKNAISPEIPRQNSINQPNSQISPSTQDQSKFKLELQQIENELNLSQTQKLQIKTSQQKLNKEILQIFQQTLKECQNSIKGSKIIDKSDLIEIFRDQLFSEQHSALDNLINEANILRHHKKYSVPSTYSQQTPKLKSATILNTTLQGNSQNQTSFSYNNQRQRFNSINGQTIYPSNKSRKDYLVESDTSHSPNPKRKNSVECPPIKPSPHQQMGNHYSSPIKTINPQLKIKNVKVNYKQGKIYEKVLNPINYYLKQTEDYQFHD